MHFLQLDTKDNSALPLTGGSKEANPTNLELRHTEKHEAYLLATSSFVYCIFCKPEGPRQLQRRVYPDDGVALIGLLQLAARPRKKEADRDDTKLNPKSSLTMLRGSAMPAKKD